MELKVNTQNERLNVKKTLDQSRQRVDEGLKQLPSSLQLLSVKDNVPETAISATNDAMKRVGAKQNKQQYDYDNTIESLGNLNTSESANWDTNQAYDMMQSTRAMILQHPGTAMLSQANQAPQQLLQLLGR